MNFLIHAYILCTIFQQQQQKTIKNGKKIGCSYRGQTVKIPSINTLKIFGRTLSSFIIIFLFIARFVDICVYHNNTLV